jgi:hypothetical protein
MVKYGWNRLAFHYKPTNTVLLVDETQEDQEEGGRRRNMFRGRNRRFAQSMKMMMKKYGQALEAIPLSNNTLMRRIESTSRNNC